jgi:hypothetical protein
MIAVCFSCPVGGTKGFPFRLARASESSCLTAHSEEISNLTSQHAASSGTLRFEI